MRAIGLLTFRMMKVAGAIVYILVVMRLIQGSFEINFGVTVTAQSRKQRSVASDVLKAFL